MSFIFYNKNLKKPAGLGFESFKKAEEELKEAFCFEEGISLFITGMELQNPISRRRSEDEYLKLSPFAIEIQMEFEGKEKLDLFFKFRSNFNEITTAFCVGEEDRSYFDSSTAEQNFLKSEGEEKIIYSGICFHSFVILKNIKTTKDINFLLEYGR